MGQVAYQAGAYPLPPLDGMLLHHRVTPNINLASTHLHIWVERGTVRVQFLPQEHNTMSQPGLEPGPLAPELSPLTMRPPCLPQVCSRRPLTLQGNGGFVFHHTFLLKGKGDWLCTDLRSFVNKGQVVE